MGIFAVLYLLGAIFAYAARVADAWRKNLGSRILNKHFCSHGNLIDSSKMGVRA